MVIDFSSQIDLFLVKFAWFKYIIGKFVKEVFLDHFGSPQTTTEINIGAKLAGAAGAGAPVVFLVS